MQQKQLIVLFGHQNDREGHLTQVAMRRCDAVIKLFHQIEGPTILPTGAFGRHFNLAEKPHTFYLSQYLKAHGIPEECILRGTDSSNTLEDCLCIRKIAIDGDFTNIFAVTSSYHMPRVRYICGRVLRGLNVSFESAFTPDKDLKREERREKRSWKKLRKEWVKPTLYEKNTPFPSSIYEAAAVEQKHYDNISLATITAMIIVSGYVLFSHTSSSKSLMLFLTAFLNYFLFLIYEKTAQFSWVARRIMASLEISYGMRGFSANYGSEMFSNRWGLTVRNSVRCISWSLILFLILRASLRLHPDASLVGTWWHIIGH